MADDSLAKEIVDWPRFNEIRELVDADSFAEILRAFQSGTEQHLQTMQDALDQEEFEQIRKSGHALRGGASNLGATQVGHLGSSIEDAALSGDKARLTELLQQARLAVSAFNQAI